MRLLKTQHGMSRVGWLILVLFIIILVPGIKIIPVYIKDMKIHDEMNRLGDNLLNSQANIKITPEIIRSYLLNRFALKGIPEITADEIIITETDVNCNVRIRHQFKERIIKDKYFILNFDRAVNIPIILKD
jgi:hypothetical protein